METVIFVCGWMKVQQSSRQASLDRDYCAANGVKAK